MYGIPIDIAEDKGLKGFLRTIFRQRKELQVERQTETDDYIDAFKEAREELENINKLFNYTSDPDLIDYAILEENAVKKRFSYLVKKAKEKNIRCKNYFPLQL